MRPGEAYDARVARGELEVDAAQAEVARALDRLYAELLALPRPARGWRRRVGRLVTGSAAAPLRGIYLWGSVGRGKTLLMDMFYGCLPFDDKARHHFHRFMALVHASLKTFKDRENPLDLVADRFASQARVLCFDELTVHDIADAMILGKLFAALFARGVTLAATSNIRPQDLYRDGLQRQQFLPAIKLIEAHTEVLHVGGQRDYRLRVLERADVYQFPSSDAAEQRLSEYFDAIAPDEPQHDGVLDVLGRAIRYRKHADGVLWCDFGELCDGPRSQNDYIEVSKCYQTVLVSNVPQFDATLANQARRFVALVDELYDRRVKLIVSAAVSLDRLWADDSPGSATAKRLRHDFARTRSRLQEMQSHDYLAAEHRA